MRLRALAVTLALTAGAAGLAAGTAQAAVYTPFTPTLTCDAAAGTVTARATGGGLVASRMVLVEFRVRTGTSVAAGATTPRPLPEVGTVVTVPTRTNAAGEVAVTGYTRPWTAAAYDFYTEVVRVRVLRTDGSELLWSDAKCTRDVRAGGTLICDPDPGSITAAAAATRGFVPGSRVRLEYRMLRAVTQRTPDEPRWGSGPAGYPALADAVHHVTPDAAGAWTDTGYVHQYPGYHFAQETVEVLGFDQASNMVVLRSGLTCSNSAA